MKRRRPNRRVLNKRNATIVKTEITNTQEDSTDNLMFIDTNIVKIKKEIDQKTNDIEVKSIKKNQNANLLLLTENEILESRTRTTRRASQPFSYQMPNKAKKTKVAKQRQSVAASLPSHAIVKKPVTKNISITDTKLNKETNKLSPKSKIQTTLLNHFPKFKTESVIQPRNKTRINYSEELIDQALMYEELLLNKQHSKKKLSPKEVKKPPTTMVKLNSKLQFLKKSNEITLVPLYNQNASNSKNTHSPTAIASNIIKGRSINPAVTVQVKPNATITSSSGLQISEIKSLSTVVQKANFKSGKIKCGYCRDTFKDTKQLAIHQLDHLKIATHKIGSGCILHPRFRRVSSFFFVTIC